MGSPARINTAKICLIPRQKLPKVIITSEIDDLLSAFAERRFDLQLEGVEVRSGNQIVLQSKSGRLFGTPQKKLLLEFNAPQIAGRFPMDILGSDDGFDVTAKAPNGWSFSTFLFMFVPMAHLGQGMVEWRAEMLQVSLQRASSNASENFNYIGFIDQLDVGFENGSVRLNEFGKEQQSLDWLEIVGADAKSTVRRGEKSWSTVQVTMDFKHGREKFHSEIKATLNGLSLRMGRRLDHFCAYSAYPDSELLSFSGFSFSRPPHSGNQPLIPLILDDKLGSTFIALAKDFSQKQVNSKVMDLLYSVWDAELVSRENHRLQIAIALESLAKSINKANKGKPKSDVKKAIEEDEEKFYLVRAAAVKLFDTLEGKPGHVQRLKNVVERTSLNDSGPSIQTAAASLGLSFSDQETHLWRKMRHPAAHGDGQDFEQKETDFYACQSMLYRLVLLLIGWTGPRIKYSEFDLTHTPYRSSKPVVQVFKTSEVKNLKRVVKPGESF